MVDADWWKVHNNGWEHFDKFRSFLKNLSFLTLEEVTSFGGHVRKLSKDLFLHDFQLRMVKDEMEFRPERIYDRQILNYLKEVESGKVTHDHLNFYIPFRGYWNQIDEPIDLDTCYPSMNAVLNARRAPEKINKNIPSGDSYYFLNYEGKTIFIVVDGVSALFSHEALDNIGKPAIDALVANILTKQYPKTEKFQNGFKAGNLTAADILLDMNDFLYHHFLDNYGIDLRAKDSFGDYENRFRIPGAAAGVLLMDVDEDTMDVANVGDTYIAAFPHNNNMRPLICTPNTNYVWDIVTSEVMDFLMSKGYTYEESRNHPLFLEWIKVSYNSKAQYGCDLINGTPFIKEEPSKDENPAPVRYKGLYSNQCKLSDVKRIAMGTDGSLLPGFDLSTDYGKSQLYASASLASVIGLPMWFLVIQRMLENDPSKIHLSRERMGLDDQLMLIVDPNSPNVVPGTYQFLEDCSWAENMWQFIQGDVMTFPYRLRTQVHNPASDLRSRSADVIAGYGQSGTVFADYSLVKELFSSVKARVYTS